MLTMHIEEEKQEQNTRKLVKQWNLYKKHLALQMKIHSGNFNKKLKNKLKEQKTKSKDGDLVETENGVTEIYTILQGYLKHINGINSARTNGRRLCKQAI